MGPFILGILVGWLAEWLFFTFWVKGGTGGDSSDCSALRAELAAKNKEIAALKASTSATTTTSKATSVSSAATAVSTATAKTAPVKKATTSAKKSVEKKTTAKKPATKTSVPKKAAAKKSAVTKATPVKKATTIQKSAPRKKAAPVKKSVSKTTGDDLTKLSGIGPSMAATLGELGITSYKELAAMDDDILRDMLEASGARLNNNKDAMDSWNEQALLADKGDFAGLKKLQEALKK